ncbi:hypothetical protein AMECASPLE_023293 [Ameca splendens]|uniref:Uncharacterized protein n=1 Tax=Ameca splendens TaxID=208324 RepID=A0ABV0YQZ2_9TELE
MLNSHSQNSCSKTPLLLQWMKKHCRPVNVACVCGTADSHPFIITGCNVTLPYSKVYDPTPPSVECPHADCSKSSTAVSCGAAAAPICRTLVEEEGMTLTRHTIPALSSVA